jgi:hypothetical protein
MVIRRRPNVRTGPVGNKIIAIAEHYPNNNQIYVTSGMDGDHGATSHHYGLTYAGSPTAAIDFGFGGSSHPAAGRDFAKWWYDRFWGLTVEEIHTTPFNTDQGFYVKNQRRYPGGGPFAGATARAHRDHVHIATSSALADQILARTMAQFGLETPAPAPAPVNVGPIFGWDTSDFDHDRGMRAVNITNGQKEGIRFFTHKISEGTKVVHAQCGEKLKAAAAANIPFIGAYVVPRTPGNNGHGTAVAQAQFAIAQLDKQFPEWRRHPGFFWQVDLEHWPDDEVAPQHAIAMAWELRRTTYHPLVFYAPKWAYGDSIPGTDPLWSSDYRGSGAPAGFKTMYDRVKDTGNGWVKYSGRIPVIWQYASDSIIGGQKTCDANVFKGGEEDFAAMLARTVVE